MTTDPRRAHMPDRSIAQASERAISRMEAQIEGTRNKTEADFRPAHSSERCGKCDHARIAAGQTDGTCEIVAGRINEGDVCDWFQRQSHPERHGTSIAAQLPDGEDVEDRRKQAASDVDKATMGRVG